MKKLMLLVVSLFTLFVLFGCKRADVVVYTSWGKDGVNQIRQLTKEFTKKTGITVSYESGGWKDIKTNTEKALSANTQPNLVFAYNDHIAAYNRKNKNVVNLKPFIDSDPEFKKVYYGYKNDKGEDVKADIADTFKKEGTYFEQSNKNLKGGIYNLPLSKSTDVIYYNKDKFKDLGLEHYITDGKLETWEGIKELANEEKVKELLKNKGLKAVYGYDSDANYVITDFEQRELPYTEYDKNGKGRPIFSNLKHEVDDRVVDRFYEYRKNYKEKQFITKATNGDKYPSEQFKKGQLLFTIGSTGGAKHNIPKEKSNRFEVGVLPAPQHNLTKAKTILQGPNIAMLDNGKEANEKAFKLLKFLLSKKVQKEISFSSGYSSVLNSIIESNEYSDEIKKMKDTIIDFNANDNAFEESMKRRVIGQILEIYKGEVNKYYSSPAFAKSTAARDEISSAFSDILVDDIKDDKGKKIENPTDNDIKEHIKRRLNDAYDRCLK